jgi:tryptophan synthase alpha chain
VGELRAATTAPIAVGFGVRTAADVAAVHDLGADAAVVGTATVERVERALADGRDPVGDLRAFVGDLRPNSTAPIPPTAPQGVLS